MSDIILLGSSNADYHNNRSHLSSSALKLLLKSPEQFYAKYVAANAPPEPANDNFILGTLVHALVLEPATVAIDYAIYPGLRRSGNVYEEFLSANPGKIVVTAATMLKAQKLAQACFQDSNATEVLQDGLKEYNMIGSILDVPVKVRTDHITPGSHVADVKTSSMPTGVDFFRQTLTDFDYDLSAALYVEVAKQTHGVQHDFYWPVISKTDFLCETYKASVSTLSTGMEKVLKAVQLYKQCMASGLWQLDEQPTKLASTDIQEV